MGFSKKFAHCKPYKRVLCINPSSCKFLRGKEYGVIAENDTVYRIQFDSRGSKQYSKDWFTEITSQPIPQPKPKPQRREDNFDTSTLYDLDDLDIDFI